MATIAIGDIHGRLDALQDLLDKVLPDLRDGDTLVFLGDIIDRGPDSRGCLERILRCRRETPARVLGVMGNHEQWMLRTLADPTLHSWLVAMEAFPTVRSYSEFAEKALEQYLFVNGRRILFERVPFPYRLFFDSIPPEHLDFLQSMTPFARTPDVLCVHAAAPLNGKDIETRKPDFMIWGVKGFPDNYRGEEPVVYGHWNNALLSAEGYPRPCVLPNRTYGIDTITHGVLTAMRFPDLKLYQSRQYVQG